MGKVRAPPKSSADKLGEKLGKQMTDPRQCAAQCEEAGLEGNEGMDTCKTCCSVFRARYPLNLFSASSMCEAECIRVFAVPRVK